MAPSPERPPRRAAIAALYVGGFLGPFGGGLIAVLIPQLRDAFGASTSTVTAGITAYLLPFAAFQLVSGTIGERLGRRRVVRTGYLAYALVSVGAGLAPSIGAFLAFRAAQGTANAFLTPLLLAGLVDVTPGERLGRAVGTFAAVQTAAVAMAPLTGGLLGALDWRLAFFASALVAVGLALLPPEDPHARPDGEVPSFRMLLTRRVAGLSGAAFAAYAGVTGLGFLVAIEAADRFGLGSAARGLVLAGFGIVGMLTGRAAGGVVDRVGPRHVVLAGSLASAAVVAGLGFAGRIGALTALWLGAGLASTAVWAGLNTLIVSAVPENRAGATSLVSAFKFAGNALAPFMWLPLYHVDARLAFGAAAAAALAVAAFVAPLPARDARAVTAAA